MATVCCKLGKRETRHATTVPWRSARPSRRITPWPRAGAFWSFRESVLIVALLALLNLAAIASSQASDVRWDLITLTLSQIESGCNPKMVGARGEITEYQILPENWVAECRLARLRTDDHQSRVVARLIAWRLLSRRVSRFEEIMMRPPKAEEIYALWNAPGALAGKSHNWRALSPTVRERCRRFAALYEANLQRVRRLASTSDTPMGMRTKLPRGVS